MSLENYSRQVREALRKAGIDVLDEIRVESSGKTYRGILMPRSEGDADCIVLKREDGYNIGVRFSKETGVTLVKRHAAGIKRHEQGMKFSHKMPPISLVPVGGTIASRIDYRTGGVYGLMKAEEILANIPELMGFVNIKRVTSPFTKMSEDFDHADWQELAETVYKELLTDSKGVVITHGTDTMHYTAAALSFMLQNLSKPVVLVGAQKSSDRGSSDAGMNLVCAARVALSGMAEVGICMHATLNDDYCHFIRGVKARKMDTVRRDAFRPVNDLPLANVWPDGRIEKIGVSRGRKEGKPELRKRFEEKVAIIKAYPGSDPGVIDYYISKGFRGFVIEATALGHVPSSISRKPWIPVIKKYTKEGIPFVVTSQCIYGRLNPNVYTNLRLLFHDAGAICGQDMTTETAYVKLGWVMGQTEELEEVKKMMLTNIAGEISERTLPETFLY